LKIAGRGGSLKESATTESPISTAHKETPRRPRSACSPAGRTESVKAGLARELQAMVGLFEHNR